MSDALEACDRVDSSRVMSSRLATPWTWKEQEAEDRILPDPNINGKIRERVLPRSGGGALRRQRIRESGTMHYGGKA